VRGRDPLHDWLNQHRRRRLEENDDEMRRAWLDSRPIWERWGASLDDLGYAALCVFAISLGALLIVLLYDLITN
jgi:hypothetical protein